VSGELVFPAALIKAMGEYTATMRQGIMNQGQPEVP
jgi:hypothetical protein